MLHRGCLEKVSPASTVETHSPLGIEKTLNNIMKENLKDLPCENHAPSMWKPCASQNTTFLLIEHTGTLEEHTMRSRGGLGTSRDLPMRKPCANTIPCQCPLHLRTATNQPASQPSYAHAIHTPHALTREA